MNKILIDDFKGIAKNLDKKSLYNTKWLLTGVSGMVGSYLLNFLCWFNENEVSNSMEIVAIARKQLNDDNPNIGHLMGKEYLSFKYIDLSTDFTLDLDNDFNFIIHGASNASPQTYLKDPIGTINTNVSATQKLLDFSSQGKYLRKFIFISSGEIYGDPEIVPTPEDYKPRVDHLHSRSCYVESKRFGETLCLNYSRMHDVPVVIVRPVHIFGPGFRTGDSRVWADFIIKVADGLDIEIMGDGMARRGFCYLADAISQIFLIIHKGESNNVYNIGNEEHISVKDLANYAAQISPHKINIIVRNNLPSYMQGSPQISCPSIKKVDSLGPTLRTGIQLGLKKSLTWYNIKYKGIENE